jgi:hypothetical protein
MRKPHSQAWAERISTQFLVVPKLAEGVTAIVAWKWALEQGIQMTATKELLTDPSSQE